MSKFFAFVIISYFFIKPISSIVHLKSLPTSFVESPARFTVRVNSSRLCGALHVANPLDACSSLLNGYFGDENEALRFVLIIRGKCSFEEKIRNAQAGGFDAALVYDDQERKSLISMMGSSNGIWMHAVFISNAAGEALKLHARGEEEECCIISPLDQTAWTVLVISFISVLFIVSLLATIFFARNQWQSQQQRRQLLDDKFVEVLPSITFNTRQLSCYMGENCAICLEEYKIGETLKVLPCQHDFHAGCLNSWLTKWGTFCPICKQDVRTVAFREIEGRPYFGMVS